MKNYLMFAAAAIGLVTTSCYYDPYTTGSVSYGASSYGSVYSSSVFVSTGDPRWAYDPYRYSYYDRYSSRYYDPYRNGYYPVGYCPVPVRGCPHPYNWSGSGYCPPPRSISSHTLSNCDNRVNYYRSANHSWSRNVSSSGAPSWMSSSERSRIHQQATQSHNSRSSSWNQGGSRSSYGSSYQAPPSSRSSRGSIFSSPYPSSSSQWNGSQGRSSSSSSYSQPRTFVRETPSIQPRPSSGGLFDGMDRSSRPTQSVSPSRSFDRTPQQVAPRQQFTPPAPQPSREPVESPRASSSDSGKRSPFRRFGD